MAQTAAAQPASGASGVQVITAIAQGGAVSSAVTVGPALTPTPLRGPASITLQDNNQTLRLVVGDNFELKLGGEWNWQVTIGDEGVVAQVPDAEVAKEAQGVYKALAQGQAELTADGDPVCRQSRPPCMLPSILFRLTVIVM